MKRIKTYAIITLGVLFLIVVIQNAVAVNIRFLFWHLSMSRALLFPLILVIGFGIGYLYSELSKK